MIDVVIYRICPNRSPGFYFFPASFDLACIRAPASIKLHDNLDACFFATVKCEIDSRQVTKQLSTNVSIKRRSERLIERRSERRRVSIMANSCSRPGHYLGLASIWDPTSIKDLPF